LVALKPIKSTPGNVAILFIYIKSAAFLLLKEKEKREKEANSNQDVTL
jgi:hypothetical protein